MDNLTLIVAYLLIGWLLQITRSLPENSGQVLNQYVIYVAVPAMVLIHLPSLQINKSVLAPIFTPWVMFGLAMALVLLLSRLLKWSKELTGAMLIVVPLGNTSFMGFPMVTALYGEAGLPYAVLYDQAGSFLALILFSSVIAARYGRYQQSQQENNEPTSKKQQALKLLTFPPLLAMIAALLVGQEQYPGAIQPLLESLAQTLVPVVMIAVGLQLKLRVLRHDMVPFALALTIKLLVLPLCALMTFKFIGANDLAAKVAVLEAAMPPMITAGALAIAAGLKPRLVAAIIGYGVLIGMVSLPAVAWLTQATL
ncbi:MULTISPECIES: AEC family transporter [Gammaproteobacteria]|uniref:AEC family transporter n=1 Tax=Gammaproteobacteria TaxID=1236 RepID=UPI000DD0E492|nr:MULTISPECIES: AEC family transporter [Gammaproteobacteria]RTE86453.1 AEC family transporter [Aliidiomarina sp. B3213]TCZ90992.1 AEC family transporter [Lysobacter sp. N42]